MAKYQVIRPWNGVKKGAVLTLDRVHPALAANVMEITDGGRAGHVTVDVAAIATEQANRIIAEAKETIDKMVSAARTEADRIVADGHAEAERIRAEAAGGGAGGTLTPATPGAGDLSDKDRKALIVARLKELKVDFDARKSADDLAALLSPADLAALFPAN
ncbi:hypothetical protein [Bordetella sp. BOR01]|uniref:hypothetical protein n=1 Tax=Bordetella sp. BOR01 TaxID=2854779 RepID=UPI001C4777ED|nr:hypothetical protein [Bordetella sp. BOR01]MBV7482521.1 hypothetical protein [Bordetella sp. BOR01]